MAKTVTLERRRDLRWVLLLPITLFLAVFYAVPLLRMLELSLFDPDFTLKNYIAPLTSPVYARILWNTVWLGIVVTSGCLLLGYPVAFLLATSAARTRHFLMIAVVLPYFTSILVRSYAWLVILGRHGLVNEALSALKMTSQPLKIIYNTPGVVISMIHILLPVMIFALYSVMQGVDWRLGNISSSLGATRTHTFFRVYLPLSLPGIGAGCVLVFIFSVGFYVTPALVGGLQDTILPMLIATQINELLNWGLGSALAIILLVFTLVLFLALNRVFRLDQIWSVNHAAAAAATRSPPGGGLVFRMVGTAFSALLRGAEAIVLMIGSGASHFGRIVHIPRRTPRPHSLEGQSNTAFYVCNGLILFFLLAPIVLIVPVSFTSSLYLQFPPQGFSLRWYQELWDSPVWLNATYLSVRVALTTMTLAVVLGTLAGVAFSRTTFRGIGYVYAFILTPLIVPVIVIAVALYALFSQIGLIGTFWALVLGHLIGACPLVTVLVTAALRGFDLKLEQAALSLGASPLRAFLQITLPITAPAIVVAAFFAFMYSFDEVVIASFLGSINAETLPKKMWEGVRLEIKPHLAAISSLLVGFTALVLVFIELAQRRQRSVIHQEGGSV
ncbi:MAG: ABC transporter permease subunit [Bradyrhizobium sp.]|uniref:ABC transporter permease subunit n=1 Tax=Bradyrhizobium sp. TaxID=376 RepID=UPI00122A712E|nr:ABC transporter permease subunit [Bradyrhizobium sp.]THD72735.1 MAG: ABC transporter permease subunit [Bradyrhizobium sp.]